MKFLEQGFQKSATEETHRRDETHYQSGIRG